MKKILVVLMAITFSLSAFSQIDFKFKGIGGGISLGSQAAIDKNGDEAMGIGINVNGLAQIMEKIDAEAGFTFYFPSEPVTGFKFSLMGINVNGHYNFLSQDKLTAYGLAGIQMGIATVETPSISFMGITSGGKTSETKFGLNIGAGGNYAILDMLDATAQVGYTLGADEISQLYINLGVLYKF